MESSSPEAEEGQESGCGVGRGALRDLVSECPGFGCGSITYLLCELGQMPKPDLWKMASKRACLMKVLRVK